MKENEESKTIHIKNKHKGKYVFEDMHANKHKGQNEHMHANLFKKNKIETVVGIKTNRRA